MAATDKKRLLIFIVAYNAERTIDHTLRRIPAALAETFDVEILVIDDASRDQTFERGEALRRSAELPFKLTVLFNPVNQGYGGNQKIGFFYAIQEGFDYVALVHGDGQYAPECLPELLAPLVADQADVVFGSRMLTRFGALRGGMPLYKFVGNRILTGLQNRLLQANLSEFHSGYRIYSTAALRRIPFHLNSNVFHFDTEIIIQLLFARQRISELAIPTFYGEEICHVNGLKYAWDVLKACLKAHAQGWNLFYDRKFDCRPLDADAKYRAPKLGYASVHSYAQARIAPQSRVLEIGGTGAFGAALRERGCRVTGVAGGTAAAGGGPEEFVRCDLAFEPLPVKLEEFDYAVMLEVLAHLPSPEEFVDRFRKSAGFAPHLRLILSVPNVAFFITRLNLLRGKFNYSKRGILDLTHTRLFTFKTLRMLMEQAGFTILETRGVPAPFPLAVGEGFLGRMLLAINGVLIGVWRSLFAYQIFMVVQPRPALPYLLREAQSKSRDRAAALPDSTAPNVSSLAQPLPKGVQP